MLQTLQAALFRAMRPRDTFDLQRAKAARARQRQTAPGNAQ
jgi:hypothetical protein